LGVGTTARFSAGAAMPRRPATFRQHDLARALRAAKAAGIDIERIEIEPASGRILLVASTGDAVDPATPVDIWLAKNARSAQGN